ncbi:MAG TPA: acyl-CoA dehydrogenase family protein [Gammaproteobacteria bacterium]|jgi:alkylation response protein AidB-like acyl-CoA dehydrogenase|nr:acyl-CoA dehydrogenase family protein [Gammaproteobacteria bacterium]HJN00934.1 acyl-CoA dehydrogenase family protein [Gammaproteobacteria bacterium]
MHINLPDDVKEWIETAERFLKETKPWEVEAEMNSGKVPEEIDAKHRQMAIDLGLSSMGMPKKIGGQELSNLQQVAVWEVLGRSTNALTWCFSEPQAWMLEACNEEQIEKYILPLMDGSRHECYAITESESGSELDVSATARKVDGGYIVNGEKWYVTGANHADFFFIQAVIHDGDDAVGDALFFLDMDQEGIEHVRTPLFSHTFDSHHPIYKFNDVFIPEENLIGSENDGMSYSLAWFRRERLMIAARCCGAAARLIEEASEFAQERKVKGGLLSKQQAIQFMLADSVTELWAARLMLYETAMAHDRGDDLKALHYRCSAVKLFASEMANKVADRVVQIFGGRGYMREFAAERFYRELRVDRIWEGTSEVQRLIIAGGLLRKGLKNL